MYISKKNAIHVPFSLTTRSKTADNEEALLDSGATHNFIDKQMAKRLGIGSHLLESPRMIRNANGTTNASGPLNRFTDLEVYYSGISEVQRFYITNHESRRGQGNLWLSMAPNLPTRYRLAKCSYRRKSRTVYHKPGATTMDEDIPNCNGNEEGKL